MKSMRFNLDKLIAETKKSKREWGSRTWAKNDQGEMVQGGKAKCLPIDKGEVVDNPDSPVAMQLVAFADEVQGTLGASERVWVARKGKAHDIAYLIRFDKGRPECVDAYVQLPASPELPETEDWIEIQETADLPYADDKGIVTIGAGAFHVEQGTRGFAEDSEDEAKEALMGGNVPNAAQ